jgi:hypothetical protein
MMKEINFAQAIAATEDVMLSWHYWGYLHRCTKGIPIFINPRPVTESDNRESYQYIGRKDEDGRAIFDGSIIRFATDTEGICVERVFWNEKEAGWYHTYSDRPPKKFWDNDKIPIRVIGHIANHEKVEQDNDSSILPQ